MSGGVAYVLDKDNTLYKNLNKQAMILLYLLRRILIWGS